MRKKFLLLGFVLVIVIVCLGCSLESTGTAPRILDAGIFPVDHPEQSRYTTVTVGQTVDIYLLLEDLEKDASSILVYQDSPDEIRSSVKVNLSSMNSEQVIYLLVRGNITAPIGVWKLTFIPEDFNGNVGNNYIVTYIVQ